MSSQTDSKDKRHVWYTICPVGNASYIAAKKGWLETGLAGAGVIAKPLQSLPGDKWVSHFTHEQPSSFRDGGNIPALWTKSRGADTLLIGLNFLAQKQYVLVSADSAIQSVEELIGRRLALPSRPNSVIDFWKATVQRGFSLALSARGLSDQDVAYVDLPVTESYISNPSPSQPGAPQNTETARTFARREAEALRNGEVDAVYAGGTRSQALIGTGEVRAIFEISQDPEILWPLNNVYPSTITVSKDLAQELPEVVVEYLKQVILAADWAKNHRGEALTIFADQTYGTESDVSAARPADFHQHLVPNLSEQGLLALDSQKRFLTRHGYIQNYFDVEAWADPSFLEAALSAAGDSVTLSVAS